MLRLLLASLLLCSGAANADWHQHTFAVMGTEAHLEFWLDNDDSAQVQAAIATVVAEMERVNQRMSPYIDDSELSQLNRTAATEPVTVSQELFDLLTQAQQISELSAGAFDISYASVGYQYDYRQQRKPPEAKVEQVLAAIDYRLIQLNQQQLSVAFAHPDVRIDLGGIAKGHAVARSLEKLQQLGINHALVSAGGDTAMVGDRLGRAWMVGIKHPRAEHKTAVHLPLQDEAISTSGDYERFFIDEGVRYHHIINPKTGDSARKVVSVSVIGPDPTTTDALSTAVFVLGLQQGLVLIEQLPEYQAVIIDNQQTLHLSSGLTP
ncbi:FAD:protein FMN transferase [Ferrimonas senticii]|uniref:FAD:protein FMN transferase n=1 Tax=Ferrimonas senticii TaxID=394566 RepID=UPI00041DC33B|nr:FAD:protein FMN transferase [Ferrimonas senticii]